jgi:hypothetical protein
MMSGRCSHSFFDRARRATVVNVMQMGALCHERISASRRPVIPAGERVESQFFPLLDLQ